MDGQMNRLGHSKSRQCKGDTEPGGAGRGAQVLCVPGQGAPLPALSHRPRNAGSFRPGSGLWIARGLTPPAVQPLSSYNFLVPQVLPSLARGK